MDGQHSDLVGRLQWDAWLAEMKASPSSSTEPRDRVGHRRSVSDSHAASYFAPQGTVAFRDNVVDSQQAPPVTLPAGTVILTRPPTMSVDLAPTDPSVLSTLSPPSLPHTKEGTPQAAARTRKTACNPCRKKRIKCEGEGSICESCLKWSKFPSVDCTYDLVSYFCLP
jgi:hypothetical protein